MTSVVDAINRSIDPIGADWTTPSFDNGWSAHANGFGYLKRVDGIVHIHGRLTPGTETNGTGIFTLPVGFRPVRSISYVVVTATTGGAGGRFYINTAGTVTVNNLDTGGAWYDVDIKFLAEN